MLHGKRLEQRRHVVNLLPADVDKAGIEQVCEALGVDLGSGLVTSHPTQKDNLDCSLMGRGQIGLRNNPQIIPKSFVAGMQKGTDKFDIARDAVFVAGIMIGVGAKGTECDSAGEQMHECTR